MSDKLYVLDTVSAIPLAFERKNRQQEIDVALNLADATRPPRPELRTDVVNDFQTLAMQRRSESQVELGPVDEHDCIRRALGRCGPEFAESADEFRQHAADFDNAHNRQLVRVDNGFGARLAHQRPSRTE